MKKIFALPGLLLPISIIAVNVFIQFVIGNSALDIQLHDTYFKSSKSEPLQVKYWLPMIISWVFHIFLGYIKPTSKMLAWLHVSLSIVCFAVINYPRNSPFPRRYYDYQYGNLDKILRVHNSTLFWLVVVFMALQLVFWLCGIHAIIKHTRNTTTETTA